MKRRTGIISDPSSFFVIFFGIYEVPQPIKKKEKQLCVEKVRQYIVVILTFIMHHGIICYENYSSFGFAVDIYKCQRDEIYDAKK